MQDSNSSGRPLAPRATLVVEWENAIDAGDRWVRIALSRLEAEMARVAAQEPPPPILYLYDANRVREDDIRGLIREVAPRLLEIATVRFVANPGHTYYQLKNYGAQLAETDLVILLDSDTGPLPGWYDHLLSAFADPDVMAAGGMTILGTEGVVSKTFALTWFYPLAHEGERAERRQHVHANNLALRRVFFLQHPFPELPAFKVAQTDWQRQLRRTGVKIPVISSARLIHAPPSEIGYWPKRAWLNGGDRDYATARRYGTARPLRFVLAPLVTLRATLRGLSRVVLYGHRVELPVWQMPAAFAVVLAYNGCAFFGQLKTALLRPLSRTQALPQGMPLGVGGRD